MHLSIILYRFESTKSIKLLKIAKIAKIVKNVAVCFSGPRKSCEELMRLETIIST